MTAATAPHLTVVDNAQPNVPLVSARPLQMEDMVGQEELREQLRIVIAGARLRGMPVPHVLLSGPAGHGKSTLSAIIAGEVGGELVKATGVMLRKPTDLAAVVLKLKPNAVLFIDEVHRMPLPVAEALYECLEDGKLTVVQGSGADAETLTHDLPPFTCVGATTNPGMLSTPFRERFGFHGEVTSYKVDELAEIVRRAWKRLSIPFAEGEPHEVAKRCKRVPRLALHLADRVLDYVAVKGDMAVKGGMVDEALGAFGIDERGLTRRDWQILEVLCTRFRDRTVGLSALAQAIDMDPQTLADQYEPPLVHAGLIARTKTGRMATADAHALFEQRLF